MSYEVVLQYIRPELFILVLVLYGIGVTIKNSMYIKDEFIPFILGFIGIVIAAIYILSVSSTPTTYQEVLTLIFEIIIQGLCCAGLAVYANQISKQAKKITPEDSKKDDN